VSEPEQIVRRVQKSDAHPPWLVLDLGDPRDALSRFPKAPQISGCIFRSTASEAHPFVEEFPVDPVDVRNGDEDGMRERERVDVGIEDVVKLDRVSSDEGIPIVVAMF